MRWYVNEASLQGQFADERSFVAALGGILRARIRSARFRRSLSVTRTLGVALVVRSSDFRSTLRSMRDVDLRRAILHWVDRSGPFMEDDRIPEHDDYFECFGVDVTDGGLGEAARRVQCAAFATAISFPGGAVDFAQSPLVVDHGLEDERLARVAVPNVWTPDALEVSISVSIPSPTSWSELEEVASERFENLMIGSGVFGNGAIADEPFKAVLADRALVLLDILNRYMRSRAADGSDTNTGREIVQDHFVGARALFTDESSTNLAAFARELRFVDPADSKREIIASWHGKVSHRFFRLHFEWPVPARAAKLKVVYYGPKLTKS